MRTASVMALNAQGFHRMVYHEWGSPDNERVLVCVHGLARNGRDFDDIAKALSREYRVICPDVVGRGASDWLPAGCAYGMPQYMADMTALLARLDVAEVDWLGTSMGGIIGMLMASLPNTPIRRLVLNDIGAYVSGESLARIGDYLVPQYYTTLAHAQQAMQATYPGLSGLSDAQWQHLATHGYRQTERGWTQHYDPAIGEATRAVAGQAVDLWPVWRAVQCPQLLIWGEVSDVLTADTVAQMQRENADLSLYSLPNVPHVPSLMEKDQIDVVTEWLRKPL